MARSSRRPGELELPRGTRLLDRYAILDRIGSGGMATIYRATDERLERVVCVKLLRTTLATDTIPPGGSRAVYQATYTHFLREALALSKLQHPNTLRIYDFGYFSSDSAEPAPLHVSEYLDGGNLDSRVRGLGPLPVQETLGILLAIGGALAEAHEHRIIHRDIKPSNILFARVRGEMVPKLADFGIAHSNIQTPESHLSESVSTVALFSPRWAAPEQLCGTSEDARTDVYALGLLAVFMLTGKVLFGDEDVRLTFDERVRDDALVTSRLAQLGLSSELGHVLASAIRARSETRIASAPELADRLRAVLEPRGSVPFPPSSRASVPPPPLSRPSSPRAPSSRPSPLTPPIELRVEGHTRQGAGEHTVVRGGSRLRHIQVDEKLDFSFSDPSGGVVRFRVTMLPGQSRSVNVKGLSCFVAKRGGRTTSALTAQQDTAVDLVSATRQVIGAIAVYFGEQTSEGHLFVLDGGELLVTYQEAQQAIVVALSGGSEAVVMCRS